MRRGRGRLSSIDLLPDWAEPAVVNALAALRDNKLPQIEILDGFNAELRTLGFAAGVMDPPQVSAAAFNRKTMRLAQHGRRLAETREIASALATKFEQGSDDDLTVLLAETIKTLVFEMLERSEGLKAADWSAEMMANFSVALANTERAKKLTVENRMAIDKNFKSRAEEAVKAVAESKGLSKDVRDELMREMLGVRKAP